MKARRQRSPGLALAIQKVSLSELARRLGLTPQAVSQWVEVPPERCPAVEAETGVPREFLRPDIYGDAKKKFGSSSAAA